MAFIKEAYSETRVDMIYELLKKEAEHNDRKDYDISVDGLKVVSRNNDPERFFEFEEFVLPDSSNITINVHERSHRCTRYILLLKEEESSNDELSGIEGTIVARMKQEKAKWDYKKLEEDYNDCMQKLKECEEYSQGLQDKIHELETEKSKTSGQLTSAIVGLAGTYLSNNPNALSGIPIIGSLLGKGRQEQPQALAGPKKDCLCSDAPQAYTGEITVGDDLRMKMALIPYFKEDYREKVRKILVQFHVNNFFVDQAYSGLDAFLKKQNKQETGKKAA